MVYGLDPAEPETEVPGDLRWIGARKLISLQRFRGDRIQFSKGICINEESQAGITALDCGAYRRQQIRPIYQSKVAHQRSRNTSPAASIPAANLSPNRELTRSTLAARRSVVVWAPQLSSTIRSSFCGSKLEFFSPTNSTMREFLLGVGSKTVRPSIRVGNGLIVQPAMERKT